MCHNSTKCPRQKENLTVLVYTYMKICYTDFTSSNLYGNLLN